VGLEFAAWLSQPWVAQGEDLQLVLVLRNRGLQSLRFETERTQGFWPFRSRERAVVRVVVERHALHSVFGLERERFTQDFSDLEEIALLPGSEVQLRFALPTSKDASSEYTTFRLQPTLYPLSLMVEGESQRFVTLRFPAVQGHAVPESLLHSSGQVSWDLLSTSGALPPRELAGWCAWFASQDLPRTVDELLRGYAPGDPLQRRRLLLCLRWLTGLQIGDTVESWRSWWHSPAGSAWARDHGPGKKTR
jgi:hypothetical protein